MNVHKQHGGTKQSNAHLSEPHLWQEVGQVLFGYLQSRGLETHCFLSILEAIILVSTITWINVSFIQKRLLQYSTWLKFICPAGFSAATCAPPGHNVKSVLSSRQLFPVQKPASCLKEPIAPYTSKSKFSFTVRSAQQNDRTEWLMCKAASKMTYSNTAAMWSLISNGRHYYISKKAFL